MQFFDTMALAAVVSELRGLGECRIDKVGQTESTAVYLKLRAGRTTQVLYIDLNERWARMHLTRRVMANLPVATPLTMLLRKHLEGSRLLSVEQPGFDRVARLAIAGRDELGDPYERWLMVELIGKYANLFLVDSQTGDVMGCLRPVTEAMCRVRQLWPGLPYAPPPTAQGKVSLPAFGLADLTDVLASDGLLLDCLSKRMTGLGKLALAQLLDAAGIEPTQTVAEFDAPERLWRTIEAARKDVLDGQFQPRWTPGKPWSWSMWTDSRVPVSLSASAVLADYFEGLQSRHAFEGRRMSLLQRVELQLRKARARIGTHEQKLLEAAGADEHRIKGELIYGHLHRWRPGSASLSVNNYYQPDAPEQQIPLDERLSASENAQRYFKRYQKLRQASGVVQGLLVDARVDLAYLEQLHVTASQALRVEELEEIQTEVDTHLDDPKPGTRQALKKGKGGVVARPLVVPGAGGSWIMVGRNNKQNDELTFRVARPEDWWLHAQNLPGAHVVVRPEAQELDDDALADAALLAAWFSRGRDSQAVSVVYVQRKHVRKIRQGRPGMVNYAQERVLHIKIDQARVDALLARAGEWQDVVPTPNQ